jgi:TRAP-type mannitol/chloroaromatic compound transport system permease large subunit
MAQQIYKAEKIASMALSIFTGNKKNSRKFQILEGKFKK